MPDNYGQQFASGTNPSGTQWITVSPPEPARILAIDEAIKNVTTSTAYVYEMAEEVRQIADSLFGAIPQPGSAEKNSTPMASGRLGGLAGSTSGLSAALSKLHAEIRRFRDL